MGYFPRTGKVEVVLWGYVGGHSTEQSCYVMSLSTGRQTARQRELLRMKPTSSRSPALPGPIKQPTRWGCGEAGWSVYPAYRQSSMVGPNACTLQMDHLPTEDGGGSHSADEWYDVVRFTIARNSGSAMPHWTNQWPRDAKLREAAGSQRRAPAEAYVCLAWERLQKTPCASSARQPQMQRGIMGERRGRRPLRHSRTGCAFDNCAPDHTATAQVDQAQSTVARTPESP